MDKITEAVTGALTTVSSKLGEEESSGDDFLTNKLIRNVYLVTGK